MTSRIAIVGITAEDELRVRGVVSNKVGIEVNHVKIFPADAKPIEVGKDVIPKKDGKLNPDGVVLILCDSVSSKSLEIYQKLEPLTKRGLEIKKGHQTPESIDALSDDQINEWLDTGVAPEPEPEDEDLESLLGGLDDDEDEPEPEQKSEPEPKSVEPEPEPEPVFDVAKSAPPAKSRRARAEPVVPSMDDVVASSDEPSYDEPKRMQDPVPSEQVRSFDPGNPTADTTPGLDDDDHDGIDKSGSVAWDNEEDDYQPINPKGRASAPAMDIEMDSDPEPIRDEPPTPQYIPEEAVQPIPDPPRPNIRSRQQPDLDDHYGKQPEPRHNEVQQQHPDVVDAPRPNRRGGDPYMDSLSDDDRRVQQEIRQSRHRHGNLGSDPLSPTKKRANVILVTGSNGGVGKTTCSWMFANTMALAMHELNRDVPVWLVETDYKNPKLQERLDIEDEERNLGNIASAVARAGASSTSKSRTMRKSDIRRLVEENTIVMEETGLRVLVCPYNITRNEKRYIEFALIQSLDLISAEGGYVFLDSGTMTARSYDLVDFNIAKRFVSKAVVVSDAGHYSEFMRTCWMLANEINLKPAHIGVMLNKSNTKVLPNIKKNIPPYKLIGFFPYVQEIEPSSSSGDDRAWVGEASPKVIENLKEHSGYALLQMGIREMEKWFETRSPIDAPDKNIVFRLLRRLLG